VVEEKVVEEKAGWSATLNDPVGVALRAREEVWARMPWWWRLRKVTFMQAVEVYVQKVLRAYAHGAIEGWPPGPDGQPTMDTGLLPRYRRRVIQPRLRVPDRPAEVAPPRRPAPGTPPRAPGQP
jgi:hypothetical protein